MSAFNFDLPGLEPLSESLAKSEQAKTSVEKPSLSGSAIGDVLGGIATGNPLQIGQGITGGVAASNPVTKLFAGIGDTISWTRVAAFVVGLLLIGGGILMFRQTQVVINAGKRIGEIAAL